VRALWWWLGNFSYTPAAGTVLGAGNHTLGVLFTPSDSGNYTTASASVTVQVNKAVPVLSWPGPSAMTYGEALGAGQLNATANVAGNFSYTPAAGTVLGAGNHTLGVLFTPSDSGNYTTASASVAIVVEPDDSGDDSGGGVSFGSSDGGGESSFFQKSKKGGKKGKSDFAKQSGGTKKKSESKKSGGMKGKKDMKGKKGKKGKQM